MRFFFSFDITVRLSLMIWYGSTKPNLYERHHDNFVSGYCQFAIIWQIKYQSIGELDRQT